LARLKSHPLWDEINSAKKRYHEVPYSRMVGEHTETGYIDLLCCASDRWQVIDFKTDSIHSDVVRNKLTAQYKQQMNRYQNAVETLLGQIPKSRICFLDDFETLNIVSVN
jgi:ATP-dependent exoDNAse (exonuclease V) beta subunit